MRNLKAIRRERTLASESGHGEDCGALYIISVAARLVDLHPSTLRKYERVGFLEPSRLSGKLRLYSVEDITRLRQIKYLAEERGINLAGIELALELTEGLSQLREKLERQAPRSGRDAAGQDSPSDLGDFPDSSDSRERLRLLVDHLLRLLGAEADAEERNAD